MPPTVPTGPKPRRRVTAVAQGVRERGEEGIGEEEENEEDEGELVKPRGRVRKPEMGDAGPEAKSRKTWNEGWWCEGKRRGCRQWI